LKATGVMSKRGRHEDDNDMLDVNENQIPDHPSTFMKMIKGRENSMSAAND
jgi:hypothetical protein